MGSANFYARRLSGLEDKLICSFKLAADLLGVVFMSLCITQMVHHATLLKLPWGWFSHLSV